eukprot:COSAG02_NODE_1337_length_13193_cov_9.142050_1_plen_186_part_00
MTRTISDTSPEWVPADRPVAERNSSKRWCLVFIPHLVLRLFPVLLAFARCAPDLRQVAVHKCVCGVGVLLSFAAGVVMVLTGLGLWKGSGLEDAKPVWLPILCVGIALVGFSLVYVMRQSPCCSRCHDKPWESRWRAHMKNFNFLWCRELFTQDVRFGALHLSNAAIVAHADAAARNDMRRLCTP